MAPRAGFEPATLRLTAGCSAVELPRNILLVGVLRRPFYRAGPVMVTNPKRSRQSSRAIKSAPRRESPPTPSSQLCARGSRPPGCWTRSKRSSGLGCQPRWPVSDPGRSELAESTRYEDNTGSNRSFLGTKPAASELSNTIVKVDLSDGVECLSNSVLRCRLLTEPIIRASLGDQKTHCLEDHSI